MSFHNRTRTTDRGPGQGAGGRWKQWLIWLCVVAALAGVVVGVVYLSTGPGNDPENVTGSESFVPTDDAQTTGPTGQSADPVTDPVDVTETVSVETEPTQTQPTTAPANPTNPTNPAKPTNPTGPAATEPEAPTSGPTTPANSGSPGKEEIASGTLTCDEYGRYSGQYVEDGTDALVENVAAIRVTNRSGQFLDIATLKFDIGGRTATFVVSGLPAGRSAWVLEATRMTIGKSASFRYLDGVTSFRSDVTAQTDRVTITANGNMLTATNNTNRTLENVFVYYRTLHSDGYFLGGITYAVSFGTLEPGQSVESLAGHYDGAKSEIVRIGWTTE